MELLDYLEVARFEGAEAAGFLQSQLSADIDALEPGDATFACYCSPRGQVYALLLVCRVADGFRVVGSGALLPAMLDRLRMFVFRTRVEFALDEGACVYGLPAAEAEAASGVFRPEGKEIGYLVTGSRPEVLSNHGFRAIEIMNRITWLEQDSTEKYIPQMLGFEELGAVSFSKGCYPGQEIVARAHYLGKVKRSPVIVSSGDEFSVGVGDRIELNGGGEWLKGVVVDFAEDAEGVTHLFVVAPSETAGGAREFRLGDQGYRCATT